MRLAEVQALHHVDLLWYLQHSLEFHSVDTDSILGVPAASALDASTIDKINSAIEVAYNAATVQVPAKTPMTLMLSDPKMFFLNSSGATAVLGVLVGAFLWFLPSTWLNRPCRWIRWPTPEEFNNTVYAHNAWVERVLSDTLLHDFGVQEGDKFTIHGH
jgi:hypothetical protein